MTRPMYLTPPLEPFEAQEAEPEHDSKTCDEEDCYACQKERCDDMSAAMDCWNPYA